MSETLVALVALPLGFAGGALWAATHSLRAYAYVDAVKTWIDSTVDRFHPLSRRQRNKLKRAKRGY